MYCGKCGADKGDSVLCPVCEGGGVNNGFLAAQKMKMIWICSIVFTALAFLDESMYILDGPIDIEFFVRYYLYMIPFALTLIFVILKGERSVFISFAAFMGIILLLNFYNLSSRVDWDWGFGIWFNELLYTLMNLFLLAWNTILFCFRKRPGGWKKNAPYVSLGVYLGYRVIIEVVLLGYTLSLRGITSLAIRTAFHFFITMYIGQFDKQKMGIKSPAPAFAPAYGASAPQPMYPPRPAAGEPMYPYQAQPTYSPQPAPQPVYQPVYQPAPAPASREKSDEEVIATLKQYKELLDSGAITQEDYDRKKDQLLK